MNYYWKLLERFFRWLTFPIRKLVFKYDTWMGLKLLAIAKFFAKRGKDKIALFFYDQACGCIDRYLYLLEK